ncbi:NAD(P)H-binding protein [Amycolatopsis sp., V23-08]|uniref:NAD(P)H-binding protein n=1 Tax=Amycolatopsis heterodermiae TaxID=3110235 RepID=A0ABU5R7W6_9PSEU|nr:NAD(P)H-binding protein [Amycolatopsis sp., V23-08]MEA5362323.1 NAD(P)H-binding protein [Amycolatopsis sp., V23-08]
MSIVITGASGHLGRRTAELLLTTNGVDAADVVLLTRSPDKLTDLAARGAQVRHGDFADPRTLPAAFAGATRVLLISIDAGAERVDHHRAAIEAAKAAGVGLIAYTSYPNPDPRRNSASVVPDHAATEAAILGSGVPHTFLRNNVYSEYVALFSARNPLTAGAFVHNFGDGASAYVSREDCAAAAAAVLAGGGEHAGKTYDVAGPEPLTGTELAGLYASAGGTEVEAVSVDDGTWIADAVANGLPEPAARNVASFGRAIREGALSQRGGDVEQLTGRRPVSVGDVLKGMVD